MADYTINITSDGVFDPVQQEMQRGQTVKWFNQSTTTDRTISFTAWLFEHSHGNISVPKNSYSRDCKVHSSANHGNYEYRHADSSLDNPKIIVTPGH